MRSLIAGMMMLAVAGCDPGTSPEPESGLTVEESATCVALMWIDSSLTATSGFFHNRFSPRNYGHESKGFCPDNDFVVDILPEQPGTLLTAGGPVSMGIDVAVDNTPLTCLALTANVEIDYLHVERRGLRYWQRTTTTIQGQPTNGNCLAAYSVNLPVGSNVLEARVGVNAQWFGVQRGAEVWTD
jgi:hypothetical protein